MIITINEFKSYIVEKNGIKVFHGSKEKISNFDFNKIKGENGNSDYGWGAYFSARESSAKEYGENVAEFYIKNDADLLNWSSEPTQQQIDKINKQLKLEGVSELSRYDGTTKSGATIYNNIYKQLGTKKKTSEFLSRAGIDGIRFYTKGETENYTIFSDNTIQK